MADLGALFINLYQKGQLKKAPKGHGKWKKQEEDSRQDSNNGDSYPGSVSKENQDAKKNDRNSYQEDNCWLKKRDPKRGHHVKRENQEGDSKNGGDSNNNHGSVSRESQDFKKEYSTKKGDNYREDNCWLQKKKGDPEEKDWWMQVDGDGVSRDVWAAMEPAITEPTGSSKTENKGLGKQDLSKNGRGDPKKNGCLPVAEEEDPSGTEEKDWWMQADGVPQDVLAAIESNNAEAVDKDDGDQDPNNLSKDGHELPEEADRDTQGEDWWMTAGASEDVLAAIELDSAGAVVKAEGEEEANNYQREQAPPLLPVGKPQELTRTEKQDPNKKYLSKKSNDDGSHNNHGSADRKCCSWTCVKRLIGW